MTKKKYSVQQEMELYDGFHYMTNKYGKVFIDWYYDNTKLICDDFPLIETPSNEMEKDSNLCFEKIKNPRQYTLTEITTFEKKVCIFLARLLSCDKVIIEDECKKMDLFMNRYYRFRNYYMTALEL